MIKTFRGLIVDGAQDTIVLHTNDGSIGYQIKKFEVMSNVPGTLDVKLVVQIFSTPQTLPSVSTINFSDQTLLAANFTMGGNTAVEAHRSSIIFDNRIVNQDIFITNKDAGTNAGLANYYIELEQVKLDLNENTAATLKDIRNAARTAVT